MNHSVEERLEVAGGPAADGGAMIALLKAAGAVRDRLEAGLESVGLSPAKYQALDALVEAEQPLALSELAGCLNCVRSNVTQLADRLESDGLLRRVDDPADRRAIRAVVTPAGVERHAAGTLVMRELESDFAATMSASDLKVLLRVFETLANGDR
jgi:DNA-binding MarR family transcriptional regulator